MEINQVTGNRAIMINYNYPIDFIKKAKII